MPKFTLLSSRARTDTQAYFFASEAIHYPEKNSDNSS